jgi:hypothetical protein
MRWHSQVLFAAAGLLVTMTGSPSAADSKRVAMPFPECEGIIAEIAADVGVEPVVLASEAHLWTVRIDAADGLVTVSCNRTEGTMFVRKEHQTVTRARCVKSASHAARAQ